MRALLTLATLKPTEDRLTGSVVLALMNWMSKGDRATAPFSQGVVQVRVCERGTMVRTTTRETLRLRIAEVCSRTQVSIPFLKFILIRNIERSEICPNAVRAKKSKT